MTTDGSDPDVTMRGVDATHHAQKPQPRHVASRCQVLSPEPNPTGHRPLSWHRSSAGSIHGASSRSSSLAGSRCVTTPPLSESDSSDIEILSKTSQPKPASRHQNSRLVSHSANARPRPIPTAAVRVKEEPKDPSLHINRAQQNETTGPREGRYISMSLADKKNKRAAHAARDRSESRQRESERSEHSGFRQKVCTYTT
jgi:hypothetical protein